MQTINTTGQTFANGQAIEIVRAADDTTNLALLHWNGEHSRIANRLELKGKVYEAPTGGPDSQPMSVEIESPQRLSSWHFPRVA